MHVTKLRVAAHVARTPCMIKKKTATDSWSLNNSEPCKVCFTQIGWGQRHLECRANSGSGPIVRRIDWNGAWSSWVNMCPWHLVKSWSDLSSSSCLCFIMPWREEHHDIRFISLASLVCKLFEKKTPLLEMAFMNFLICVEPNLLTLGKSWWRVSERPV